MSGHLSLEMELRIVAKALKDPDFRRQLTDQPRKTLEKEISEMAGESVRLPEKMEVTVLQENLDELFIVLPHELYGKPLVPYAPEVELTDLQLEQIASAASSWGASCSSGVCTGDTIIVNQPSPPS